MAAIGQNNDGRALLYINMRSFGNPRGNILETGDLQSVLDRIENLALPRLLLENGTTLEMMDLLYCLTQTFSMVGQWKGYCISILKGRLISLARVHPSAAKEVLEMDLYFEDTNFLPLIKQVNRIAAKADYTSKNVIQRFWYQLSDRNSADNIKFGLQFLAVNGIFQVFGANNSSAQKVAIATGSIGGGVLLKAIGQAAYKAYYKEFSEEI